MNRLKALHEYGQSPWLDYIRRTSVRGGEFARMIAEDGLMGVTSNPSIFEKAIGGSTDYADALKQLAAKPGIKATDAYESLAVQDIQDATDLFKDVYEKTRYRDGYVSLEVSPGLAHNTEGTLAEARRLWKEVNRPNLMIKVPGTKEGIPAFRQLISEGINVNVTLLFAVEQYELVAAAYIEGLEALAKTGKPLNKSASVASFFVSRIDTLVNKHIEQKLAKGDNAELKDLVGKIAIANAKVAYQRYKSIFSGPRWQALASKGARPSASSGPAHLPRTRNSRIRSTSRN